MPESRIQEFMKAAVMSGLTIFGFKAGNYLGEKIVEWQDMLNSTEHLFGSVGRFIVGTADSWAGWYLATLVLLYARRALLSDNRTNW